MCVSVQVLFCPTLTLLHLYTLTLFEAHTFIALCFSRFFKHPSAQLLVKIAPRLL